MTLKQYLYMSCILLLALTYLNTAITPGMISPLILYSSSVNIVFLFTIIYSMKVYTSTVPEVEKIQFLIVFISIYSFISLLWAQDFLIGLRYVYFFVGNWFLMYLFSYAIDNKKKLSFTFNIVLVCSVVQVFIGLVELLSGIHLPNSRQYVSSFHYEDVFVPTGSFYNENNFSSVLSLGVGLFITQFFVSKKILMRFFYLMVLIVSIILINKTESRINQVAVVLSFFMYFYIRIISSTQSFLSKKTKRLIINLLLFILVGLGFILFFSSIILIFNEIFLTGSADAVRYELAKIALTALIDSNFIGIGPGGFELFCSVSYANETREVCAAHNWLLELGANFGIVILIAQLYIYIKIFRLMVVAVSEVESTRLYFIGLSLITAYPGAVLSGVSISSIIGFSLVWCYLGILLAYVNIVKTKSY